MPRLFVSAVLSCLAVAGQTGERGFVQLFDGTLNGWKLVDGKGPGYVVENGVLVCLADGGGNLFTEKEYANFVLRFEFRLTPGGNNGIGIRTPLDGRASYLGMEIQILDDEHEKYRGQIKATQYHGSIYDVVPAEHGFKKPTGEWNAEEITADRRHITAKRAHDRGCQPRRCQRSGDAKAASGIAAQVGSHRVSRARDSGGVSEGAHSGTTPLVNG
jgi:hypothetical protein